MPIDPNLTGSVINALPIDRMIAGPLNAMIKAQVAASRQYADFLMNVCLTAPQNGGERKALNVQFDYDETLVDHEGNVQTVHQKTMRVPLLAVLTHPTINVEEGSVDFELEINQAEETHSETEAEGGFEASAGWGPFKVSIHGKVSHHTEQTRKTDTRAKYSIHTAIKRSGPPEALMRVIDFLTDAATKPTVLPAEKAELKQQLDTSSLKELPSGEKK